MNLFVGKGMETRMWTQWGRGRVGRMEVASVTYRHSQVSEGQQVRSCCVAQGAQLGALQ